MTARDLIGIVEELRAPYGIEKSVKIAEGAVYDDRCLISVHRDALGPEPAARLRRMADAMGIPAKLSGRIEEALAGADIVHFGHEAGGGGCVRKLYFEYADAARRAIDRQEPALVHLALKWTPGGDRGAVARYTWSPCRTLAEAEARIDALMPASSAPRARRSALSLLSRITALADAGLPPMMEVEEADNPRRSCDMNVYDCALTVGDVRDLIDATAREFAVSAARVQRAFGAAEQSALGHLSAGLGREGGEFVTFYFGVEGR